LNQILKSVLKVIFKISSSNFLPFFGKAFESSTKLAKFSFGSSTICHNSEETYFIHTEMTTNNKNYVE